MTGQIGWGVAVNTEGDIFIFETWDTHLKQVFLIQLENCVEYIKHSGRMIWYKMLPTWI